LTSKQRAQLLARALEEKKGLDIRVLDLREARSFTDFFVIATATSDRHAKTLSDAVVEAAQQMGDRPFGVEGEQTARWILVDLSDLVVHVFQQESRDFYNLERLWGDAVELPLRAAGDVA
jgi:ribosome-associated protein